MIRIAIDGPAGAGKSTIAKKLAKTLDIDYIDTGAMYRALALKFLRTKTDWNDPKALESFLSGTAVDFDKGKVFLDGEDVSSLIRSEEISQAASKSSALLKVREKLVALQKEMGKRKSLVMDGRDISSKVLPDAEFKFYLDASPKVRAIRRAKEMEAKGLFVNLLEIEEDIKERDQRDMNRENSPLEKTADAILVDTSDMTIEEVCDFMLKIIKAGNL